MHLISCLLLCCYQSDYWNNKYHASCLVMEDGCELLFRVEKNCGSPSHRSWRSVWNLSPIDSIVSVGIVEALGPRSPPPSSARTPVPGHPVWLMEAWPRRILHPLWDRVAGAGPGGEWVGGELQPVPDPTGFCVHAGHQSSADEVRGCLNYVSVVLIKNLWGSCNWLKWGFRAVHGSHLMMPSISHHDLG